MITGTVFNIQSYSLHDGPGIRTTVFLKGCPLRCLWCANPESQRREPEICFDSGKCIHNKGCSRCMNVCTAGAVCSGQMDFSKCTNCRACAAVCPSKALHVYGQSMSVNEVVDMVERETAFYRHGKGGMTLSGGEPLMQAEFAIAILMEAKRRCLHTAIETCGACKTEDLHAAAEFLDYIMFDIKLLDEERHIRYTGGSNKIILANLEMLFRDFPEIPKLIRTPVIPTVNDTAEDIVMIQEYLSQFSNYQYELLPYHRFGQNKYRMLGREYPDLPDRVDDDRMELLRKRQRTEQR